MQLLLYFFFFFFNDTATTEIYTLSLHDALPIYTVHIAQIKKNLEPMSQIRQLTDDDFDDFVAIVARAYPGRSEEHTSELQSRLHLVCRLLLEKKKINTRLKSKKLDQVHTLLIAL